MDISNTNRCGNHVYARRHILKIKKLVTLNITHEEPQAVKFLSRNLIS